MDRKQALNQLRIMRDWHEDNGNGPNADYDAICAGITALETQEYYEKLITALETEHAKLREMQSATDINVGATDTISRQQAIDALAEQMPQPYTPDGSHPADKGIFMAQEIYVECIQTLEDLPPAQLEIIHCKNCAKHNKGVGDFEVLPDGKRSWIWKDQACPLVSWRGKAQGHEFDYQYCVYAERRTDG